MSFRPDYVLGPLVDRTGYRTVQLMEKYAAPDAVRSAPTADVFDPLPIASNFADTAKTYPLHTAAATWASAAAYHDGNCTDPEIGARIKEACVEHRLKREWTRLEAAAATGRAQPVKESSWALSAQKKYPLDTPDQIKMAADYFSRHADALTVDERKEFAAALVKVAGDSADDTARSRWEAEAGFAQGATDPLLAFRMRARLVGDPVLRDALTKVAAVDDPHAAADLLRRVDRRAGLSLPDPIEQLTGLTPTQARAKIAGHVRAASGNWYAAADLDRVPDVVVQSLFDAPPVVSRRYKEDLLKTAAAFERVVADHGALPVAHARRPRPDWTALAVGAA